MFNNRSFRDLLQILTLLLISLCCLHRPLGADTRPPIVLPKKTVKIGKYQAITAARHTRTAITEATFDTWTSAGSQILQKKDSPSDVACPVQLVRQGVIGVFIDQEPFHLDIINSLETYLALRQVPQRVKIVTEISWCNEPGVYNGCSDTPGTHIVITSSPDSSSLVHEFGHNKGLAHESDPKNLMYESAVGGNVEVTRTQCQAFEQ